MGCIIVLPTRRAAFSMPATCQLVSPGDPNSMSLDHSMLDTQHASAHALGSSSWLTRQTPWEHALLCLTEGTHMPGQVQYIGGEGHRRREG